MPARLVEHQPAKAAVHHHAHHAAGAPAGVDGGDGLPGGSAGMALHIHPVIKFQTGHRPRPCKAALDFTAGLGIGGNLYPGLALPVAGQQAVRIGYENLPVGIQVAHGHLCNFAAGLHPRRDGPADNLQLLVIIRAVRRLEVPIGRQRPKRRLPPAGGAVRQLPGQTHQGFLPQVVGVGIPVV